MKTKITWLGHSCFKIDYHDYTVIIDPYENGSVPGLGALDQEANLVLCSHQHSDHNAINEVKILPDKPNPFKISIIDTYHDDVKGEKRGKNKIHILENADIRIAHFGDLGCMLNDDEIAKLQNIDVLLIPIGGVYTIDATQAKTIVELIKPMITIPMHYQSAKVGYGVLKTIDDYLKLCNDIVYYQSNVIEVSKGMVKQTAVLNLDKYLTH